MRILLFFMLLLAPAWAQNDWLLKKANGDQVFVNAEGWAAKPRHGILNLRLGGKSRPMFFTKKDWSRLAAATERGWQESRGLQAGEMRVVGSFQPWSEFGRPPKLSLQVLALRPARRPVLRLKAAHGEFQMDHRQAHEFMAALRKVDGVLRDG